jgi:hypothetical protein
MWMRLAVKPTAMRLEKKINSFEKKKKERERDKHKCMYVSLFGFGHNQNHKIIAISVCYALVLCAERTHSDTASDTMPCQGQGQGLGNNGPVGGSVADPTVQR